MKNGKIVGVARLSREDLARFHAQQYCPDRATIVVAGMVDPDEIVALLDEKLGGWSGRGPAPLQIANTEFAEQPRILLIDRPGAPQAVVRVGHVGPPRSSPDHDALMMFNQVLGGESRH